MGLMISAQVARELISEGEYVVESIEQREHGRVAVTLALRSRAQPFTLQIETEEKRLHGLFRALLNGKGPHSKPSSVVMVGTQPVPVVEVDAMPADQPKRRRRGKKSVPQAQDPERAEPTAPQKAPSRAERRRSAIRQLVLVSQDAPPGATPPAAQRKRRIRSAGPAVAESR